MAAKVRLGTHNVTMIYRIYALNACSRLLKKIKRVYVLEKKCVREQGLL